MHVWPLKGSFFFCFFVFFFAWMTDECHLLGLKRLESGAFVKYYGGLDKELEQAVRMCYQRLLLSEESPDSSKVFFLGEHAYGVFAQVSASMETTLSVILAVRNHSRCLAIFY